MNHESYGSFVENGRIMGSLTGVPASNIADKLWLAFQALGDIAFAYPYTVILLEIQVPFISQLGGEDPVRYKLMH